MYIKWYDIIAFVVCIIFAGVANYIITRYGWDYDAIYCSGIVIGAYLLFIVFKETTVKE